MLHRLIIFGILGISVSSKIPEHCPKPIRPVAALNVVPHLNESYFVLVRLEVRSCMTLEKKPDLFFRLDYANFDKQQLDLPAFHFYEQFAKSIKMCVLQLMYDPDPANVAWQFREYFWKEVRTIHFICDQFLSNCYAVVWNCATLSKRRYKKYFKQLIREMFTPNKTEEDVQILREETVVKLGPEVIQISEEKANCWSYIGGYFLYLIVLCAVGLNSWRFEIVNAFRVGTTE